MLIKCIVKFKSLFVSINIFAGSDGRRFTGRAACMRRGEGGK